MGSPPAARHGAPRSKGFGWESVVIVSSRPRFDVEDERRPHMAAKSCLGPFVRLCGWSGHARGKFGRRFSLVLDSVLRSRCLAEGRDRRYANSSRERCSR